MAYDSTAPVSTALSQRILSCVTRAAALDDVKAAVEANHDNNRWWPTAVADPRLRMAVAGWSTRVSYAMVETYARVVAAADEAGFDRLTAMSDAALGRLLQPLGLVSARVAYLRSLATFLDTHRKAGADLLSGDTDALIHEFAAEVSFASFKVAQCAVLYSRGYHCGVIPVDSGMVSKLAPWLGIDLPRGAAAHERMRQVLQAAVQDRPQAYLDLVAEHGYAVTIPSSAQPSWWLHLVLIYFKRLYLNRPHPRVCTLRPACARFVDCAHARL